MGGNPIAIRNQCAGADTDLIVEGGGDGDK